MAIDTKKRRNRSSFPIVGIGASAGGLEAFTALLQNLPESPGMAFIFVLHQHPTYASNLAQILARATKLPVEDVRPGLEVQPDRVYVAPPDAEVAIEGGVLRLNERRSGASTVIDGFFRSLAADQGSRAVSVVLSGSASDGTLGTKAVKAEGGITFAQDDSAKLSSMPRSAVAGGDVDFVLPPKEIASELARIAQHDYLKSSDGDAAAFPQKELTQLFNLIQGVHGVDFAHYKPNTIERRIRRRMALRKTDTLRDYVNVVQRDPGEIEQLFGDFLIRVTGFFRDPDVFETLQRDVFPQLMTGRREDETVRVWVPGCATGEEVYSLAIALMETVSSGGFSCPLQIFGTDVSEAALDRARDGIYPEGVADEVGPERLRLFFNRVDGGYRVNKAVRDCCIFARQNVTKDPPFSKLDLISCRNVMIYLGAALQRKVVSIFHYALRPEGYLLLGSAETIGNFADLFGVVDGKHKIYRKKAVFARPKFEFTRAMPQRTADKKHAEEEPTQSTDVFREADRLLLDRFTPAGVLINENMEILQFRGHTSRYLEPPLGPATFNLLKMTREGLLADLRSAVHNARKKDAAERREGISVKLDDHVITVNVEVIPFIGASKERFLLVLFDEPPPEQRGQKSRRKKKGTEKGEPESGQVSRLKRELEATREYLQSIVEEQETMNEELRSANEEVQSSNEELQSTNEELETAKEELQSTNEELTTLNDELESRNEELTRVNNDLVNLLASVEIPILMVDMALRIRRFNPIAQRLLNLMPADVGRSIADLKTTLRIDNLEERIAEVIDTLEMREVEVQDRSSRWHSLRIRPYKTTDNRIDGAVLVLVYLDEFRRTSPLPSS